MNKVFSDEGWADYLYGQTQDRKTLKRINALLQDIERNGHHGIGMPELLKGVSGYWSRRIAELSPSLNPKRLIAAVRAVNDIPNAQRLGYILDRVRKRAISDALHDWVERRIERSQPLRPGRPVLRGH